MTITRFSIKMCLRLYFRQKATTNRFPTKICSELNFNKISHKLDYEKMPITRHLTKIIHSHSTTFNKTESTSEKMSFRIEFRLNSTQNRFSTKCHSVSMVEQSELLRIDFRQDPLWIDFRKNVLQNRFLPKYLSASTCDKISLGTKKSIRMD